MHPEDRTDDGTRVRPAAQGLGVPAVRGAVRQEIAAFRPGLRDERGPVVLPIAASAVALNDLEEALLVAAGVGFSGLALWDQSRPLPYRAGDGRTFPST